MQRPGIVERKESCPMSKWERIIVYPLLLLTLFLALTSHFGIVEEVKARRVVVVNDDGSIGAILANNGKGLVVYNAWGSQATQYKYETLRLTDMMPDLTPKTQLQLPRLQSPQLQLPRW
jgi:hypothetical protein